MKFHFLERNFLDSDGEKYKRRWTLEFGSSDPRFRCFICLGKEISQQDGKWRPGGQFYQFSINPKKYEFVREHDYYDGPWDFLSIGWLKFAWQPVWCKKCAGNK